MRSNGRGLIASRVTRSSVAIPILGQLNSAVARQCQRVSICNFLSWPWPLSQNDTLTAKGVDLIFLNCRRHRKSSASCCSWWMHGKKKRRNSTLGQDSFLWLELIEVMIWRKSIGSRHMYVVVGVPGNELAARWHAGPGCTGPHLTCHQCTQFPRGLAWPCCNRDECSCPSCASTPSSPCRRRGQIHSPSPCPISARRPGGSWAGTSPCLPTGPRWCGSRWGSGCECQSWLRSVKKSKRETWA